MFMKRIHKSLKMIKVFDFRCPDGHLFEEFVSGDTTVCRCDCGLDARKVPSPTRCQLDGSSGDFPGAHMKWVREHEKAGQKNGTLKS